MLYRQQWIRAYNRKPNKPYWRRFELLSGFCFVTQCWRFHIFSLWISLGGKWLHCVQCSTELCEKWSSEKRNEVFFLLGSDTPHPEQQTFYFDMCYRLLQSQVHYYSLVRRPWTLGEGISNALKTSSISHSKTSNKLTQNVYHH